MTRIADIPVSSRSPEPAREPHEGQTIGGGVVAILHQVGHLLSRLAETGEGGAIDLHSLPMAPGDYETLRSALGDGEIEATLNTGSPSRIRETAFHGAWWVQHCDPSGEVAAEYLEITTVPAMLATDPHDVRRGARMLEQQIPQMTPLGGDEG